jgi:hypothetical protein
MGVRSETRCRIVFEHASEIRLEGLKSSSTLKAEEPPKEEKGTGSTIETRNHREVVGLGDIARNRSKNQLLP